MPPIKIPYCTVTKKGELVCPECQKPISVVASARALGTSDAMLGAGIANCAPDGQGHPFAISQEIANQVNAMLAKTSEGRWRKEYNQVFEGIPEGAGPQEDDDGKGIVIL